jgi:hypothetical protein
MTFSWISLEFLLTFYWLSIELLMTFSWLSHDFLMKFSGTSHDFLMIFSWLPMAFWISHGLCRFGPCSEWVDFAYWWSCIGKGLRLQPARQACLLFNQYPMIYSPSMGIHWVPPSCLPPPDHLPPWLLHMRDPSSGQKLEKSTSTTMPTSPNSSQVLLFLKSYILASRAVCMQNQLKNIRDYW